MIQLFGRDADRLLPEAEDTLLDVRAAIARVAGVEDEDVDLRVECAPDVWRVSLLVRGVELAAGHGDTFLEAARSLDIDGRKVPRRMRAKAV